MYLIVERFSDNGDDTLGILFERENIYKGYKKKLLCFTIEDEKRTQKIFGETRIPEGVYEIKLRTEGGFHNRYLKQYGSDFHKGMLWITNVPNFEWVLIHKGNTDDDTAGCLIVGDDCKQNVTQSGMVPNSNNAYKRIYPKILNSILSGETVLIEYKDVSTHMF